MLENISLTHQKQIAGLDELGSITGREADHPSIHQESASSTAYGDHPPHITISRDNLPKENQSSSKRIQEGEIQRAILPVPQTVSIKEDMETSPPMVQLSSVRVGAKRKTVEDPPLSMASMCIPKEPVLASGRIEDPWVYLYLIYRR